MRYATGQVRTDNAWKLAFVLIGISLLIGFDVMMMSAAVIAMICLWKKILPMILIIYGPVMIPLWIAVQLGWIS